jgi:hypothetical protein
LVIPTVIQGRAADEASWPGTGLSTEWTFPTATLAGLTPRLAVWNPNDTPVDVEVDLYTRTPGVTTPFTATIEAGRPLTFPIGDQSSGAVGVRVRASGAVAAAIVAEDVPIEAAPDEDAEPVVEMTRVAGTVGAPQEALSWLLAGAGGQLGGDSSIWVLNTSDQPVTVTLQPLGDEALTADKVRVEPHSVRRIRLTSSPGVGGYRVDAAVPVTASWSLQSSDAVALFAGVPIVE